MRHFASWTPAPRLSGVEISGEMLDVARQYFALPPQQLVHVGDAVDFLGRDRAHYDLVVCDLFHGRSAPTALCDALFFASLARRLNEGGAIALNTLPASTAELGAIVEAVSQHFAGIGIVPMNNMGNVLLFLQINPLPSREVLATRLSTSIYASDPQLRQALASLRRLEPPAD